MLKTRRAALITVSFTLAAALTASAPATARAGTAQPAAAQAASTARAGGSRAKPVAALVDDIARGRASSDPRDLTAVGSELYFAARAPGRGWQLFKTDGTATGTVMLTHVPGPAGAGPQDLTAADGELFFSAWDPQHGRELWHSDGTVAGTRLASDIVPGRAGSTPQDITYAIGPESESPSQVLVYFSAWDPQYGRQLWRSDGTTAGTVMISNTNPGPAGLAPEDITPTAGTEAMFSGDDGWHGRELWITEGSLLSTNLYADINPGAASSDPAGIVPSFYNLGAIASFDPVYFSASDGTHGREFFVAYPGFPPPVVFDLNPGPASSDPSPFVSVANEIGLVSADTGTDRELVNVLGPPLPAEVGGGKPEWALAPGVGPGHGSRPVLGPTTMVGIQDANGLPVSRNFFAGDDGRHGRQLWEIDEADSLSFGEAGSLYSTLSPARVVADINPGRGGADPQNLVSVGGTPVFGSVSGSPEFGTQTGGTEVFSANDGRHGRVLWYSGGWSSNTALAADINGGPARSDPADLTVTGQTVYFTAADRAHGRELWKLTVPPAPEINLDGPAGPVTTGSAVTLTASLQPAPDDPEPTGQVVFYEGQARVGSAVLRPQAGGGVAASATLAAPSGTSQVTAVYTGDGTYLSATSGSVPVTGQAAASAG